MKKILLLLATVLSASAYADDVPGMTVSTNDSEAEIAIQNIRTITYSDDKMIVNLTDGTAQTFSIDEVKLITFGDITTAIKGLVKDGERHSQYQVTDLNGRVIMSGKVDDGSLDLKRRDLKGIYIVTVGDKSQKVILK